MSMATISSLTMDSSISNSLPSASTSMLPPPTTMKRKLEDAMQTLDDATSETSDRPAPTKKNRSLYSTLVKYGIKSKDSKSTMASDRLESLSKSAPHLAAIIARTASKARPPSPSISAASLTVAPPSCNEYRPSSTAFFLSRLSTYRLATYANKPTQIDAVAASKCGWINDGRDRLACGVCKAAWVVASTQGMNRDAANSLVEKQRLQLVSAHKDGCPWKTQQCDASVYRLPVQSPAATTKEVKARALDLEPILQDVQVKHPLSSAQVQALMSTLTTFNVTRPQSAESESPPPSSSASDVPMDQEEPSITAALTSLFGWNLPPLTSADQSGSSRASSVMPATPTLSRSSSVTSLRNVERSGTPQLSASAFTSRRDSKQHRDGSLLYCRMCQRRIGLWAFGPGASEGVKRQFDLLKEHRPYCPYVVRSTVVPTLPTPSGHSAIMNGAVTTSGAPLANTPSVEDAPIEGWRAILSIILKSKKRSNFSRQTSSTHPAEGEGMEVDRVEAMVDGVKKSGGKELLKYVKGLLG